MFKMVLLQFGATLAATAIAAVFFGLRGGVSAALGGLACVLPSGMFALRLHLLAKRQSTPQVTTFFIGEFMKIASILGLLALIHFAYEDLHWGALFIGLILALKANLFAFLVKN